MKLFNLLKKKKDKKIEVPTITPAPKPEPFIPVLMLDGTIEEYHPRFHIEDKKNCIICNSDDYHTFFACKSLKEEMKSGKQVKAMLIREAEKQGFYYCYECRMYDKECEEFDKW